MQSFFMKGKSRPSKRDLPALFIFLSVLAVSAPSMTLGQGLECPELDYPARSSPEVELDVLREWLIPKKVSKATAQT